MPSRAEDRVDDVELLDRAREGDATAFGELVTRHRQVAARVASVVAPASEVEDVLQDACVKAWHALPRFRAGAAFRPWLCRIVANEAKNRSRSARRRETLHLRAAAGTHEPDQRTPEAVALERDDAEALIRAMNRLRPEDRLLIAYRWLLDLTEAEMTEALSIPTGTVKSRLSRAMTKLRTELAHEGTGA